MKRMRAAVTHTPISRVVRGRREHVTVRKGWPATCMCDKLRIFFLSSPNLFLSLLFPSALPFFPDFPFFFSSSDDTGRVGSEIDRLWGAQNSLKSEVAAYRDTRQSYIYMC
jgi:hypothetical protein